MVAMPMEDDGLSRQVRRLVGGRALGKEVAQYIGLVAEGSGASILREEVAQLVAKDAGAGGFEKNDGRAGVDFSAQRLHGVLEILAGGGEKTEVVERASAAHMLTGH